MDFHTLGELSPQSGYIIYLRSSTFIVRAKPTSIGKVVSTSTALIPYDTLYSTIGLRLNQ